jgi:ATP-dependent Clp endopeptidase proteolytic subunit ClpP
MIRDLTALISEGQRIPRQPQPTVPLARWPHPIEPRLELRAEAESGVADLWIYGTIGGWFGKTAEEIIAELRALQNVQRVRVHINSPGGDVFEGLAIYNTLREFPAKVETFIEGVAASIASIIALAGKDGVTMLAPSLLMIHEPHALAFGTAEDMRGMARLLDKAASVLADTYATRTGHPKSVIRAWMAEEKWFEPEEAKAEGFIDAVNAAPAPASAAPAPAAAMTATAPAAPLEPAAPASAWRRGLAAREVEVLAVA